MVLKRNIIIATIVLSVLAVLPMILNPGGSTKASSGHYFQANFMAQKSVVRNFDLKVQNSTNLNDQQLSTSIQATGLFHVFSDSIFSVNLTDVSGTITGQGNKAPNWNLLRQGSAIVKFEDGRIWVAWKGEELEDFEFNALRMLVAAFPPIQKFVGTETVSYEIEDLYSTGKWIWIASNLASKKTKWSVSYLPSTKKQDAFFKRNVNWEILNDQDVWDVTGHDVIDFAIQGNPGLRTDVTTDLHLKGLSKVGFNLEIYKDPIYVSLSEGRRLKDEFPSGATNASGTNQSSSSQTQLTKAEWIEDFKTRAKIDYLALKKSFDQGDWKVEEIKSLLADSRVTDQSLNHLLGALSQTKWEGGKKILLSYLNENWKNEKNLVNYIPLVAQGPGNAAEIDGWLKQAAKTHPSAEVRTTAVLARGTLASQNMREDEAKSQIIFDELLAELTAAKDMIKIEHLLSALGNAGGENLALKFKPWLSHAEPTVRAQAYFSLRNDTDQNQAFETLLQGLTDRKRLVRLSSAQAIASMNVSTDKLVLLKNLYQKEVDQQVKLAISEVLDRL